MLTGLLLVLAGKPRSPGREVVVAHTVLLQLLWAVFTVFQSLELPLKIKPLEVRLDQYLAQLNRKVSEILGRDLIFLV